MDRHLNLFYSYNRDNELIENNLTRAFIVTLRTLQPATRDSLLRSLLRERLEVIAMPCPSFLEAEFALQGYADKQRTQDFPCKVVLTIATDLLEDTGNSATTRAATSSIPDAWVIAGESCFLIEAKVGTNPLTEKQVIDHACGWFGLAPEDLAHHHVGLTWYDVTGVIERVLNGSVAASDCNEQEVILLRALAEFLRYYGYSHFAGFQFAGLSPPPGISLRRREEAAGLNLEALAVPPSFSLIEKGAHLDE